MGRLLKTIGAQQPDTAQIEKLKEECKSYGIIDLMNPIKRSVITAQTEAEDVIKTVVTYPKNPRLKIKYDLEGIFSKSFVLRNMKYNTKIPLIDINRVNWYDDGLIGETPTITSKSLHPRTLMTFIDVSRELMNQTDEFEEQLIEQVTLKFQEALLKKIFNANDGIIAVSPESVEQITDYDSLVEFKYNGDLNPVENSFIISPLAQKKINLMKDGNLLKDNKLLGADAHCLNSMTDGYIVYCPLDCLVIAEWGVLDYTRDAYTKAADGKVRLVFRGFFDYDYVRRNFLRIGRFVENENNNENENNGDNNGENAG